MRLFVSACLCVVVGLVFSVVLAGCSGHGTLDGLDKEVSGLIERERDMSLGVEASRGDAVDDIERGRMLGSGTMDDEQPTTVNTEAADLPTRASGRKMRTGDELMNAEASSPLDPEEGALELDLEGLLGYAIEHAPEYRSEKEALFLATLNLIIERHQWGPRFFNTTSVGLDGDLPEGGDHEQAVELINDFRVMQRLPYGGEVAASALVNYTNALRQASSDSSAHNSQGTTLSVGLDLPLLRGAGQVAREDRIQAERDLVYAVRRFERFRRSYLVSLSETYFNLIFQQRQIENEERQLRSNERLAARFRALADAGREAVFQAEDAQQRVLSNRSSLLSVQQSYATAIDQLKLRLGLSLEDPLVLLPVDMNIPEPVLDQRESVRVALANRLDLQTEFDRVDDARRALRVAENNLKGDLDFDASMALRTRSDREFGGVDFDLGRGDYSLGLSYGMALDRKIEQANYRRALVSVEQSERDYRVERDRVVLQVRDSIRGIEQARLTLELQTRGVELNERRLQGVLLRQRDLGPRQVIDAEEDLLNARNTRDRAATQLRIRILGYLLDTGQMRVGRDGTWLAPGTLVAAGESMEVEDEGAAPTIEGGVMNQEPDAEG